MVGAEHGSGERAPVVDLTGDIDVANASSLGDVLCSTVDATRAPVLIVDCARLDLLEARGLAMMARVHEHAAARGTRVVWRGLAPRHRTVIRLTGLDRMLVLNGPRSDS
jgi:anti-anti-sigma factor